MIEEKIAHYLENYNQNTVLENKLLLVKLFRGGIKTDYYLEVIDNVIFLLSENVTHKEVTKKDLSIFEDIIVEDKYLQKYTPVENISEVYDKVASHFSRLDKKEFDIYSYEEFIKNELGIEGYSVGKLEIRLYNSYLQKQENYSKYSNERIVVIRDIWKVLVEAYKLTDIRYVTDYLIKLDKLNIVYEYFKLEGREDIIEEELLKIVTELNRRVTFKYKKED